MFRSSKRLLLATALAAAVSSRAAAQAGRQPCELEFETNPDHPTLFSKLPSGAANIFAGGGVRATCRGQDITLTADSTEYYGDTRILYLLGNVRYRETRAKLDAKKITYWMNIERLLAEGDVLVTLPSGTTARGPVIDYLRAAPAVRTVAHMEAPQRTVTRVIQKDSTGKTQDPVIIEANRTVSDADSLVYVSGNVKITRPDMDSRSDSAFMDTGRDFARLLGNARVDSKGSRPFSLTSALIDLTTRERKLERVLATRSAKATSDDLELMADTLDLRVRDDKLQRAFAWGKSRARAVSPGRLMLADSLDVVMPSQRVQVVRLLRGAYAESVPDSTKIRSKERDWLRGDTIVARFDTTIMSGAKPDSTPRIRDLVATGRASSYYQIASDRGGPTRPSINYVRGRAITVLFDNQAVATVKVLDKASGVYLEPGEATAAISPAPSVRQPGRPATSTPPRRP